MSKENKVVQTWETLYFNDDDTLDLAPNRTYSLYLDVEEPSQTEEPAKETEEFSGLKIKSEVGRGGMALIEAANQTSLSRMIAIKTPHKREFQHALIREAKIMGVLNHPNIISVYDLLQSTDGGSAISMPLIKGRPWSERRLQKPDLRLLEELEILMRVAQAVEYAHENGILHNDLKMENVMVGAHGNVILMDWGCATSTTLFAFHHIPITPSHKIKSPFGTPCYMSPELAAGEGENIGVWSDIYLLGAMLYEILEGELPRVGDTIQEIIAIAVRGDIRPMTTASPYLREVCLRALKPNPKDRFSSAQEFVDQIQQYFSVQAAETLALEANHSLAACQKALHNRIRADRTILLELQKIIYTYEQAQKIWSSEEQRKGIEDARVLLAETALGLGDLSLAQANLDCLSILTHVSLHTLLKEKKKEVEEERRRSRRNRFALLTLSLFLVLGLIVGNVIVRAEREVAKNRLQEIEELSGIQLYQELVDLESTLWPAIPEQSKFMQEWLRTAKELVSSLPKHEEHLRILSIKRDGIRFDKSAQRWEYETLRRLVKGLNHLNSTLIPTVELRMKEANTLVKRSILRHQEKWDEAIEKIALSDRYDGLVLKEQEGLTPLGRNEQGLWEFAHLLSGEIPKKNKKGAWEITEETGLVLVLLPAGQFLMGASSMEGAQNFDPRAADIEGPVHEISLDGFFLSKYELTQAQWLRVQSTNPSAYLPGQEQGGYTINQIHPVEHMTWLEAKNTLDRLDLVLPTEAQWEYGNRAGTQTIYWGGDEIADMRGKINISDRVAREKGSPASWKFEMELDDGFTVHAPVGSLLPNNFGLHDTSGNVWEWCLDLFGAYTQPVDSKRGIRTVEVGEARRIFRGGGFRASSVHARSADRYSIYARDYSAYDVGIRPARLLNP